MYPFGMLVPNRHESTDTYRYGFQGQEKDDEIKGEGNSLNYTFRMQDPRAGRFFAVDPIGGKYPWNSPFAFSENRVLDAVELEGKEKDLLWTDAALAPYRSTLTPAQDKRAKASFESGKSRGLMIGSVMLAVGVDGYFLGGTGTRTLGFIGLSYSMGDLFLGMDKSEQARQARAEGNNLKAQQLESEVAELSKGAIIEGLGSGALYTIGKLIKAGKSIKITAFRYELPNRVSSTWNAHEFNIAANHRYTGEGVGGVYGGMSPETALLEVTHYQGTLNGKILTSKEFTLNKILDLTNSKIRKNLGVSLDDLTSPNNYETTQKIGKYAIDNGYDAILAPSARDAGGVNVVILKE